MSEPIESAARGVNLGWSLALVLRRWHEAVEEVLADIPHGTRGYHILGVVAHECPPTQGALATRLVIDRSVLTYLLDDLETAGLLRRVPDRKDRRVRRIIATEKGRAILADAEQRVATAEEVVLSALPPEQRELFRAAAGQAAVALHAQDPTTDPCVAVEIALSDR
ncbi:MarR family transcriptional regulator [Actinoplanes sp. TBRC 11911]|uniref:MarR family winged helix-turn-helix transcriptional regulator n=1 Tax=Actinoplanes sp. TBRC 11911 TaxID=2729386 RepID=UPI00145D8F26|nr:MarR family transcriptional regulator [Actinoplanes sp. TBRC 11911]NMO51918.1 MarR family transcriptional regulator [Actinoplanes sp. TBRC 11911]